MSLHGGPLSHESRMLAAQARYERMTIAQRCEWVLSELGPVLVACSEELNPEHLPISESPMSFRLEMWGKKCLELAEEIRVAAKQTQAKKSVLVMP